MVLSALVRFANSVLEAGNLDFLLLGCLKAITWYLSETWGVRFFENLGSWISCVAVGWGLAVVLGLLWFEAHTQISIVGLHNSSALVWCAKWCFLSLVLKRDLFLAQPHFVFNSYLALVLCIKLRKLAVVWELRLRLFHYLYLLPGQIWKTAWIIFNLLFLRFFYVHHFLPSTFGHRVVHLKTLVCLRILPALIMDAYPVHLFFEKDIWLVATAQFGSMVAVTRVTDLLYLYQRATPLVLVKASLWIFICRLFIKSFFYFFGWLSKIDPETGLSAVFQVPLSVMSGLEWCLLFGQLLDASKVWKLQKFQWDFRIEIMINWRVFHRINCLAVEFRGITIVKAHSTLHIRYIICEDVFRWWNRAPSRILHPYIHRVTLRVLWIDDSHCDKSLSLSFWDWVFCEVDSVYLVLVW